MTIDNKKKINLFMNSVSASTVWKKIQRFFRVETFNNIIICNELLLKFYNAFLYKCWEFVKKLKFI